MQTNPVLIGKYVWAYPSRSKKSLEIYVHNSQEVLTRTLKFRISFKQLEKIRKAVKR